MQKMQTSEFLHLLGHSSGSAVSWDVFRREAPHGDFGDTSMAGCSFSGWGVGDVCLLCLPACFQVSTRSAILIYSIRYRTFFKNVQTF